jgi:hypothetical protein
VAQGVMAEAEWEAEEVALPASSTGREESGPVCN